MVPVKLGMTEQEVKDEMTQYYDEKIVEAVIRAVKNHGLGAYGAFIVREASLIREIDRPYNLFRLPGYIPPKRSESNA